MAEIRKRIWRKRGMGSKEEIGKGLTRLLRTVFLKKSKNKPSWWLSFVKNKQEGAHDPFFGKYTIEARIVKNEQVLHIFCDSVSDIEKITKQVGF